MTVSLVRRAAETRYNTGVVGALHAERLQFDDVLLERHDLAGPAGNDGTVQMNVLRARRSAVVERRLQGSQRFRVHVLSSEMEEDIALIFHSFGFVNDRRLRECAQ